MNVDNEKLNLTGLKQALKPKVLELYEMWSKDNVKLDDVRTELDMVGKLIGDESNEIDDNTANQFALLSAKFCWAYHIYGKPENCEQVLKLLASTKKIARSEQIQAIMDYVKATVLRGNRRHGEAIQAMNSVLAKLKQSSRAKAQALNNLGLPQMWKAEEDYNEIAVAKANFDKALELTIPEKSPYPIADRFIEEAEGDYALRSHKNRSQACTLLGHFQEAVSSADFALTRAVNIDAPATEQAYIRMVLAEGLMAINNYERAETVINKARQTYKTICHDKPDFNYMRALIISAEVTKQRDKIDDAKLYAQRAYKIVAELKYNLSNNLVKRLMDLELIKVESQVATEVTPS